MAEITENAMDLLRRKNYFQDGETTWSDICRRVSQNIASAEEEKYIREMCTEEFFDVMVNMDFIPSTPTLLNAGTKTQQLSSCFILDIDDSIESIMVTLAECAKIFQKSGGCGFNISALRPMGSPLSNSGGFASGPVSFMRLFNQLVEEVKHGNSRKGAIKIDLDVSHPDIYEFIHCKDDTTQLNNMNISVSISDDFMNAVIEHEDWDLKFNNEIHKTVSAQELWNEIITSAWKTGEPGLTFLDIANKHHMNPHLGKVKGSNPCQEFINIPYSSCNLGSINLANMVQDGKLNWHLLSDTIRTAVRFIDDMISVNKLPLEKIQEVTELLRPIGLGTMGLADMLFKLKIPMNSQEGIKFIDKLYAFIRSEAEDYSMRLAQEKGVYPAWEGSVWQKQSKPMRNGNLISLAPNGSIGFLANVNGGIEPVFALAYTRRTAEGHEYFVVNEELKNALTAEGICTDAVIKQIVNNKGSVQGLDFIPKWIQEVFITASDMTPMEHIKCLSAISKHVDLSVSKTINMPNEATVEDVSSVYMEAWKTGVIKGCTVYRDGSRQFQVLSTGTDTQDNEEHLPSKTLPRGAWATLAPDTTYYKRKIYIGCGKLNLFIGWSHLQNTIQDLYVVKSASGGCTANLQGMAIAMSGMLRLGGNIFNIEKAFEGMGVCPSFVAQRAKGTKLSAGSSCGTAILNEIKVFLKEMEGDENNVVQKQEVDIKKIPIDDLLIEVVKHEEGKCPECGAKLRAESGCYTCTCGFSMCG